MSLSETIGSIQHDEQLIFERGLMALKFTIKKGDRSERHKEIVRMVDQEAIEVGKFDILALELSRAFEIIRKD